MIDENSNDISCIDNYYYTKGRCCALGTYWNGTDCTQFSGNSANCKKMVWGFCSQCNDGFNLSQGQCTDTEKFLLAGVATNISLTIPECSKVDYLNPYVCLACKTDYELAFEGKCCTGKSNSQNSPKKYYFDPTLLKCSEVLTAPGSI